jgi:hypothetical protein
MIVIICRGPCATCEVSRVGTTQSVPKARRDFSSGYARRCAMWSATRQASRSRSKIWECTRLASSALLDRVLGAPQRAAHRRRHPRRSPARILDRAFARGTQIGIAANGAGRHGFLGGATRRRPRTRDLRRTICWSLERLQKDRPSSSLGPQLGRRVLKGARQLPAQLGVRPCAS